MTALPVPNLFAGLLGSLPPAWLPVLFWTQEHRKNVLLDFWGRQRMAIQRLGEALQAFQNRRNALLEQGKDFPWDALEMQRQAMRHWLELRAYEDSQMQLIRQAAHQAREAGQLSDADLQQHGLAGALGVGPLAIVAVLLIVLGFIGIGFFNSYLFHQPAIILANAKADAVIRSSEGHPVETVQAILQNESPLTAASSAIGTAAILAAAAIALVLFLRSN